MRRMSRQKGIGLFGFIFILGMVGFVATITIKVIPLYLNEMKIARAVHQVASDPQYADSDIPFLWDRLQRRWDIEDITMLTPKEVQILREKDGRRAMKYDYEARNNLFYNIFIVIHFTGDEKMRVVQQ